MRVYLQFDLYSPIFSIPVVLYLRKSLIEAMVTVFCHTWHRSRLRPCHELVNAVFTHCKDQYLLSVYFALKYRMIMPRVPIQIFGNQAASMGGIRPASPMAPEVDCKT